MSYIMHTQCCAVEKFVVIYELQHRELFVNTSTWREKRDCSEGVGLHMCRGVGLAHVCRGRG